MSSCADCRTCTGTTAARAGRAFGAGVLHVVSLGMSFLASRAGAHCPRCGHLPSRHTIATVHLRDPHHHLGEESTT